MKILTIMFILLLSKVESTTYYTSYGLSKEAGQTKFFGSCDKQTLLLAKICLQLPKDILDDIKSEGDNEDAIIKADEDFIEADGSFLLSNFIDEKMLEKKLNLEGFKITSDSIGFELLLAELSLLKYIAEGKVSDTTKIFGSKHYYNDKNNYNDGKDFYRVINSIFCKKNNELYFLALNQAKNDIRLILIKLLMPLKLFDLQLANIKELKKLQNKLNKNENDEKNLQALQNTLTENKLFKCLNEMIGCVNNKGSNYENIKNKFPELLDISYVNPIAEITLLESEVEQLFSLKQVIKKKDGQSSLSNVAKVKVNIDKLEEKRFSMNTYHVFQKANREEEFENILIQLLPGYKINFLNLICGLYTFPVFFKFEENGCNYTLIYAVIQDNHVTLGVNKELNKVVIVELLPATQSDSGDKNEKLMPEIDEPSVRSDDEKSENDDTNSVGSDDTIIL